jgi:membrane-bound lytic murein transglycosylase A
MAFIESSRPRRRNAALLVLLLFVAACVPKVAPPADEPPPPPPANAVAAGVRAGPPVGSLGMTHASAADALAAFRISCPSLVKRADASGLARPEDWKPACDAATTWPDAEAPAFFETWLTSIEVGDGSAFATGYFEPQILGSRTRMPGYEVPIYAMPDDLLDTNPLTGEKARGRIDENGDYVLYHDRTAIEAGALAGRGLEIAWAADPIDLFFLHIQGSGRLLLPDGGVVRIGYAGQNGREYVAIGRIMKERGLLEDGGTSMQHIVAWLRANPEEGRAIMRENKSYIFFNELTGPGPLGALGRPVTPRVTVAADPKFVPLGAPVWLDLDRAEADGLWVAQDTGGAIKGANRFDTFWGAGDEAKRIAGGMLGRGTAYILLPKPSAARLIADAAPPQR